MAASPRRCHVSFTHKAAEITRRRRQLRTLEREADPSDDRENENHAPPPPGDRRRWPRQHRWDQRADAAPLRIFADISRLADDVLARVADDVGDAGN
jgi:hypothetical protein